MARSKSSRHGNKKTKKYENLVPEKSKVSYSAKKRSWFLELGLGLLVCFAILSGAEIVLRFAGVSGPPSDEDPFVGFSGTKPLYVVKDGIASTSPERLKYFNPASFPIRKDPDGYRVFCFGGSTTYGHPFDGRTAFSRWLEDLLKASCPNRKIEVINAGGISYASYRIVPLIRETLTYSPDLMVVYTGHNEFLEKRTYPDLSHKPELMLSIESCLEKLSIYQGLKKILFPLIRSCNSRETVGQQPGVKTSNKPLLNAEVTAILDRSAGLDLYHRDENFTQQVVEHFSHNLRKIVSLCRDAAVPVVLVEPTSNLKDFSPFKSEHDPELTSIQKSEIRAVLDRSAQLCNDGKFQESLNLADLAISQDPLYAESYFLKGRALYGLKRYSEAKDAFIKAKDLDVCPLRCISAIEDQIRVVGKEKGVILVPFKEIIEQRLATNKEPKIPGNESFLDHVHPTIELHQILAEAIMDAIIKNDLIKPTHKLSEKEKKEIFERGLASLDPKFFITRDMNLAKTLKWAGKKQEARAALERAARQLTENPEVHKMLGSYMLDDGEFTSAISEYKKAVELSNDDPDMIFALALAYSRAGLKKEAMKTYKELLRMENPIPEAYANLATVFLESNQVDEAFKVIKSGLAKYPECSALFAPQALALALSGDIRAAIPWMIKATEQEPGDPSHFYNLAGMYSLIGQHTNALKYLDLAVRKGYSNAEKLQLDEVFKNIRHMPEFQKILDRIK